MTIETNLNKHPTLAAQEKMNQRVIARLAYLFLLIAAVVLGFVSGAGVFVAAAYFTSLIPLLAIAAGLEVVFVSRWLTMKASRGLFPNQASQQRRVTLSVTLGTLFAFILAAGLLVFRPMDVVYYPKAAAERVNYWDLQPTGSRLAYVLTPGQGIVRPHPVIMLHGGPGAPASFEPTPDVQRLAEAGFDVYQYDQIGAGLSGRLDDVRDYTVERHVADLEAIRQTIGAERLILVANSWGGTLAAHYSAAYPTSVERIVFGTPGAIWEPGFAGIETTDRSDYAVITQGATPRFMMVLALQQVNGQAAQNFASDEEMSAYFQQLVGQVIANDMATCGSEAEDAARQPRLPYGFGYYANMMTTASVHRTADPRPQLRSLQIPILILRGECDRIRPEVAREYQDVFSNSTFITLENVGHAIASSPQYADLVYSFLTGSGEFSTIG
jgi:proline iminopeptidase